MKVVLAEDSLLLREGLVRLLDEAGATVVAAVGDGEALVEAVEEHRPEVAVVDVRMPPTFTDEGLRAALQIRRTLPETKILVLSQYVEESYATDLLEAGGGIGYLLKDRVSRLADLSDALTRVADGGTVLDPEVVSALLSKRRRKDPIAELSPREREVLGLMAEGRTNTAIGRIMVITQGAVEKHISSIFTKLGLPPSSDDHRRVMAVLAWLGP
ncbi:response regulator transcription factor [Pseudonocardia sp. KRD291]|uniref:response regulator transcription factor n=1 Tax=Pseudonocardia sp. KRD291 TaxID=2792007 RepID=UPI001C4A6FA3|nr:response regulator transcription factor [Pseudonocardia sp. KRD291]MBW0102511.1 response regulator transcription factor [Pseudonocardia sp. KRD291]